MIWSIESPAKPRACCDKPDLHDLTQGLGGEVDRHIYCTACRAHRYGGKCYTAREWDRMIESALDDVSD